MAGCPVIRRSAGIPETRSAVSGSTLVARTAGIHVAARGFATAEQHRWRQDKCQRIPRPYDAEEEASEESSQPEGGDDTEHHAEHRQHHPLTENHVAELRRLRAQRHPNPQFLCALLHGESHQPVDANGRQQQS